jgi:hypothetical protein
MNVPGFLARIPGSDARMSLGGSHVTPIRALVHSVKKEKKVSDFPVPSRDVTNQNLLEIIKLFPARESLVSDIGWGRENR